MQQVTIIRADNQAVLVSVEGEGYKVAWPTMPASFHALQWYGHAGELEHRMLSCEHCGGRNKKPNETITNFSPYQPLLDGWQAAKTAADIARAKAEADAREALANAHAPTG